MEVGEEYYPFGCDQTLNLNCYHSPAAAVVAAVRSIDCIVAVAAHIAEENNSNYFDCNNSAAAVVPVLVLVLVLNLDLVPARIVDSGAVDSIVASDAVTAVVASVIAVVFVVVALDYTAAAFVVIVVACILHIHHLCIVVAPAAHLVVVEVDSHSYSFPILPRPKVSLGVLSLQKFVSQQNVFLGSFDIFAKKTHSLGCAFRKCLGFNPLDLSLVITNH